MRKKSRYNAARRGHAPGHISDAFTACLDHVIETGDVDDWFQPLADPAIIDFFDDRQRADWQRMSPPERARWLTGQLWNCTDQLGSSYSRDLSEALAEPFAELPTVNTVGQAARLFRARMSEAAAA